MVRQESAKLSFPGSNPGDASRSSLFALNVNREVVFNIHANVAHPVERHLPKVDVAGSSPVIRSKRSALMVRLRLP